LKKIILLIAFCIGLFGFDQKVASVIFEKLFTGVFHKEKIYVFTKDTEYQKVINLTNKLILTNDIKKSDIVIVNKKENLVSSKPIFTTEKSMLKYPNVIGGFYWAYGEPKIVFFQNRVDKFGLVLSNNLKKFIKKSVNE